MVWKITKITTESSSGSSSRVNVGGSKQGNNRCPYNLIDGSVCDNGKIDPFLDRPDKHSRLRSFFMCISTTTTTKYVASSQRTCEIKAKWDCNNWTNNSSYYYCYSETGTNWQCARDATILQCLVIKIIKIVVLLNLNIRFGNISWIIVFWSNMVISLLFNSRILTV